MPCVDVAREHEVADEGPGLVDGAERERARLGELGGEHRPRPGCGIRGALDPLDRVEVVEHQAPKLERHVTHRSASGARTYTGSIKSMGPNDAASATCRRACGRWRGSSSAGTNAPFASSTSR